MTAVQFKIGFENLQTECPNPGHWRNVRLRFVARVNNPHGTLYLEPDDDVSFVPMASVGEYGGLDLTETKVLDEISDGYTFFTEGDVIVAKITPCFENGKGALASGLRNETAYGTTELHVLSASDGLNRRYLFYLSISQVFRSFGEGSMYGAGGQKRVPERFLKDFWVPLPPSDQQRAIADFLDNKTAEIDALIEIKRRLLELLAEKRAAIITNAVTKGIDPDPPLKDSGIDWFGQVPEHWEFEIPLKYFIRAFGGMTPATGNAEYWDGDIPWVSPKDMKVIEICDTEDHVTSLAVTDTSLGIIPEGCVLFVVRGMILAHTFPVAINKVPVTLNQDMKALSLDDRLQAEFLVYFLNGISKYVLSIVDTSAHGTKALRTEQWKNLNVALPPRPEQTKIVDWIDQQTRQIDDLETTIQEAINKLQEYRSALITSAVTGNIKVV